jgi:type II secretory pathway pseudopilin PulG
MINPKFSKGSIYLFRMRLTNFHKYFTISSVNIIERGKNSMEKKDSFMHNSSRIGGGRNPLVARLSAFTLAEVLITLGVIGVVAALTLPSLITKIQSQIRENQIRMVKYKFTKATDSMKSLGLIGPYYENTEAFVNELQKHLKIAKVCTSNNLRGCWPYDKITLDDGTELDVAKITSGKSFKMNSDDNNDYSSPNVGIITADGTPMILSFNTKCEALDPAKTYSWSSSDNKPVSNATAGCVAAIFEINGTSKPNKFTTDVIAFNANGLGSACALEVNGKCFGAPFVPTPLTQADCEAKKGDLGISACSSNSDYWAGAVAQCGGVNNMPTASDLAAIANAIYDGNPSIGATAYKSGLTYTSGTASALGLPEPAFWLWSGEEFSSGHAYGRYFDATLSYRDYHGKYYDDIQALCLGD